MRLPAFQNTAVAPLVRALIGLPQEPSLDGSLAPFEKALVAG
jgi:hypothetical protein